MTSRSVPCDGCTLCCRGDLIILHPDEGDRLSEYETEIVRNPVTTRYDFALKRHADGACVYLGEGGCTIYGRRPVICRSFDCRRVAQAALSARLAGRDFSPDVLQRGRELLDAAPVRP
jgi:Fe-S-cluster containining protein